MRDFGDCLFRFRQGNDEHYCCSWRYTGRWSVLLFRTDSATNFYDRGVFFIDSASGDVYRYDWDKKELIEVPKMKP